VHVVITARTPGGLEETDDAIRAVGGAATLVPLDLLDEAAVDSLGPSLFERFGRLDILVSNAGDLGVLTPVGHIMPSDFAEAIGVNITAAWRLMRCCGPLLMTAEAGRAVFVTSRITKRPTAYWGIYGATKAALEHLALTWAEETRTSTLRVNLADPGPVASRLRRAAFPGEDQSKIPAPEDVAGGIADMCEPAETRHGEIIRVSPIPLA
jgi:NAD(P)-dependent dehydrogenase (short-subunit alcohol dehydrogenase family)